MRSLAPSPKQFCKVWAGLLWREADQVSKMRQKLGVERLLAILHPRKTCLRRGDAAFSEIGGEPGKALARALAVKLLRMFRECHCAAQVTLGATAVSTVVASSGNDSPLRVA